MARAGRGNFPTSIATQDRAVRSSVLGTGESKPGAQARGTDLLNNCVADFVSGIIAAKPLPFVAGHAKSSRLQHRTFPHQVGTPTAKREVQIRWDMIKFLVQQRSAFEQSCP
jgi:hypothetical protein